MTCLGSDDSIGSRGILHHGRFHAPTALINMCGHDVRGYISLRDFFLTNPDFLSSDRISQHLPCRHSSHIDARRELLADLMSEHLFFLSHWE